ncbi:MAG TPA: aminodeoxychorismate synthase component I [Steroidobacteraceae bacterium]|nr:aminodeoxychorismate synthase component I [Steroidobacteraceae bacterium]
MEARAPLVTAVEVSGGALRTLAAARPARYPVFFDSAAQGPLARFSLLAAGPSAALFRDANGKLSAQGMTPVQGGFLDNLEAWFQREALAAAPADRPLPFVGGWFVYLGYEIAAEIEPRLKLPAAVAPYSAFALRVENLVVHELATDTVYAVSQHADADEHAQLIADLVAAERDPFPVSGDPLPLAALEEEPAELFLARVRVAQEHIAAGDIYQANLSRRWRLELRDRGQAAQVYAALRRANPAPFAASVRLDGMTLFSSSPERLLAIAGRDISTRPIAGTRARSGSAEQDQRDTAELVAHPKERAEHVMLIDLERNDLGRVCEAGSVTVDEYMVTESYAHVHHIVSNVRGRLRADRSPVDALRALFPGGTITGCPKVRCMQIIAALEGEGRGAYTGSLGWLGNDGDADFNILIRTLTMRGEVIELRAGAGIVADSIPERELEETRAKARGLLRAFEAPHV